MKKLLWSCLLVLAAAIIVTFPVFGIIYRGTITVTETSGNAYTQFPATVLMDNKYLAEQGYIDSDGLDVEVETLGGGAYSTMLADDRTLLIVPSVEANSQTNLYYTTDNTPATSRPVIVGYNGTLLTNDDADLEPGASFDLSVNDSYWDVATANVAPVFSKKVAAAVANTEALRISGAPNGAIVVQNYGTVTNQVNQAISSASSNVWGVNWFAQTFTPTADFYLASVELNGLYTGNPVDIVVSIRATSGGAPSGADLATFTEVQANLNLAQNDHIFHLPPVYLQNGVTYALVARVPQSGAVGDRFVWSDRPIDVYAGGSKYTSTDSGVTWAAVAATDMRFRINSALTVVATGLTSGVKDVRVVQDGVNMELYVDSVLEDTLATIVAVPDNVANWTWLPTNPSWRAMPYLGSVTLTAAGVSVLQYQPNAIIRGVAYTTGTAAFTNGSFGVIGTATTWTSAMVGSAIKHNANNIWHTVAAVTSATALTLTTAYTGAGGAAAAYTMAPRLPDRDTTGGADPVDEMGIITWGANPAGVTGTRGSLVSDSQPAAGSTGAPPRETLPELELSDWFDDPDTGGSLSTNPFRPLVTMVSDNTTVNEGQTWRWFGLIFVLVVFTAAASGLRDHYFLVGAAVAASILVLVVTTVWPMWALVFMVGAILAGLIAERSPSL